MLERGWWIKSTRSNGTGGSNCVEACLTGGPGETERICVRNSRDRRNLMSFTRAEWDAFVAGAKDGEFDLPGPGA